MAGGVIIAIGLSWRTASVAVREKLAFADDELAASLNALVALPNLDEAMILSTCNRVEIYGAVTRGNPVSALAEARAFLADSRRVASEDIAGALYEYVGHEAIAHVYKVASALDSMVVGESQILGQVKDAYGRAASVNACGPLLSRCLERAFAAAKRVRSETGISRGAANVSTVAVELARRVFGELAGRIVAVVGAGKMSALAARHLRAQGAQQIFVTNRSPERAAELAAEVEGVEKPWEMLSNLVEAADVIISSTGAREPVLTRALLKRAMKARRHRPLVLVDIAVPRDVEPSAAKLDNVYLFDIDDLERVVAENLRERQKEADAAVGLLLREVGEFEAWLRAQKVVPTIRSLKQHFQAIADAEVAKVVRALDAESDPAARARTLERLGQLIVNKLLHTPMTALRQGDDPDLDKLVEMTHRLFDLPAPNAPAEPPAPDDNEKEPDDEEVGRKETGS